LILVALTEKWLPAVPLVHVLCLYAAWQSLAIMLPPILYARFRAGFLFWWNASLLVVMPFAFWAAAVWQGTVGLALAWVTVYPLITLVIVREVNKELDLRWSILGLQLLPIVKATLTMSIAVFLIRYYVFVDDATEAFFRLVSSVILGALSYTAVICWQGKHMVPELTEALGWLFRRRRQVSPAG
jgi:O-antigen/teichoic acid export membrane protein